MLQIGLSVLEINRVYIYVHIYPRCTPMAAFACCWFLCPRQDSRRRGDWRWFSSVMSCGFPVLVFNSCKNGLIGSAFRLSSSVSISYVAPRRLSGLNTEFCVDIATVGVATLDIVFPVPCSWRPYSPHGFIWSADLASRRHVSRGLYPYSSVSCGMSSLVRIVWTLESASRRFTSILLASSSVASISSCTLCMDSRIGVRQSGRVSVCVILPKQRPWFPLLKQCSNNYLGSCF